ncbi:MAG: hypothetical protein SangKO_074030 [Sandaracinaceae bacterium]
MAAALPPERVRSLTWQYDWLGNMQEWTDDAHAFYERSLGDIENGADRAAHERPAALHLATDIRQSSQPPVSIDVGADRGGWVELTYGQSGNVVEMTVHGQCRDPSASSACWDDADLEGAARASHLRASCFCATEQHYAYRWDELNRLAEARRYDRMGGSTGSWVAAVRQRYRYDSANQRTVKQTLDVRVGEADPERIALYVYPGDFERRGLVRGAFGDEYEASTGLDTETQYLVGGARVVWKTRAGVAGLDADQRVTVPLTDLIQTTAAVLDLESGELLEASTYYPNGARETYRVQALEGIAPEASGFTGKEADEEVGVVYFGERYLIPRVGRWASPDPLHVHAAGGGEGLNGFHYVGGDLLKGRDPLGLDWHDWLDANADNIRAGNFDHAAFERLLVRQFTIRLRRWDLRMQNEPYIGRPAPMWGGFGPGIVIGRYDPLFDERGRPTAEGRNEIAEFRRGIVARGATIRDPVARITSQAVFFEERAEPIPANLLAYQDGFEALAMARAAGRTTTARGRSVGTFSPDDGFRGFRRHNARTARIARALRAEGDALSFDSPLLRGLTLDDLAILSSQTGVEFAVVRPPGAPQGRAGRALVRGHADGVILPEGSRLIAHTHPGSGPPQRPGSGLGLSEMDFDYLDQNAPAQRSTVVINETGHAVREFTRDAPSGTSTGTSSSTSTSSQER